MIKQIKQKERLIDITEQEINCIDDFEIDEQWISVGYKMWFDVDEYFGTNVNDSEGDTWLDFYTYYFKDGHIEAEYCIDSDVSYNTYNWKITDKEQLFFLKLMQNYCYKLYGHGLDCLWKEI